MHYVLGLIVTFGAGFITCYFVMRNNRKYFNIDFLLKAKRDDLIAIGKTVTKEKLDELKSKLDAALKQN